MRFADKRCSECGGRITDPRHVIECSKCSRVSHANCLPDMSGVCPRCRSSPQAGSKLIARHCSVCGLSNPDGAATCTECKAPTAWRSAEECASFHAKLARTFGRRVAAGIAMAAGVPVVWGLIVTVLVLSVGITINELTLGTGLAVAIAGAGGVKLLRAREMRRRLAGQLDWLDLKE